MGNKTVTIARAAMRIEKRKKVLKDTVESYTRILQVYETCGEIQKYFGKIRCMQNMYIVAMRHEATKLLSEEGAKLTDVGLIICRSHGTLSVKNTHTKVSPEVEKVVKENWLQWIEDGVYPHSIKILALDPRYNTMTREETSFELRPLPE